MSISNAMQTGVSGLLANSSAVGKISTNIANASTDGYKRSFDQMVTSATSSGDLGAAGVRTAARTEVSQAGSLRTTGNSSDLAVSGSGMFVVSRSPDEASAANFAFTRAGSFSPDEDGNLVNAAGLFLTGFPYDSTGSLGTVDRAQFTDLETINVSSKSINGEATTTMAVKGNLPSQQTGAATSGEPFVTSQEYYTSLGAAQRVEFSWTPSTTDNKWTLDLTANGAALGSVDVTFSDSGATAGTPLTYDAVTSTATAPAAFAFDTATGVATLTVDNGTAPQAITLTIGAPGANTGMTQFAGDYTPVDVTLDGLESGQLVRFEIDSKGDLYGVFDNSARQVLYNIPLAEVPNPDGLRMIDGNAYVITQASGNFQLSQAEMGATGSIVSGSLEASNVELAEELTNLIQTQRAYSSNAKIITTVDEMMDETTRLKR